MATSNSPRPPEQGAEPARGISTGWVLRILYDAQCPLCAREGRLLERLDAGRGRIDLEDISAPDFDASRYGVSLASLEARLHGVLPDGRLVDGVEVLTRAYEAVGLGWLTAPAHWPGIRWLLDRAYLWFARNRLLLTGRAPRTCSRESGCEVAAAPPPR